MSGQTRANASATRSLEEQQAIRESALRRARVWAEPAVPIEDARLDANPPGAGAFSVDEEVECTFSPRQVGGTTPKFDCELNDGDVVKVKYGRDNPEIYAELAATRLLSAIGFPTDRMYAVKRVRCVGCPPDPFKTFECLGNGGSRETCLPASSASASVDFDDAIIERRIEGRRIEAGKSRGWAWHELAKIDPASGGASRAEVDALRLMAVFLAHWDNKPENQRLICLDGAGDAARRLPGGGETCTQPVAMVQDLGGTFGPFKVELKGWAATPLWTDVPTCAVSMRTLPYQGSSFHDLQISEQGRAFLAARLARLSDAQVRQLFEGARFTRSPHDDPKADDVQNWVRAFNEKRRAIVERPSCPSVFSRSP